MLDTLKNHHAKIIAMLIVLYFSYYNVITSILPVNKQWPSIMTLAPALLGITVTVLLLLYYYYEILTDSSFNLVFIFAILMIMVIIATLITDKALFFAVGIALLIRKWDYREFLKVLLISHLVTLSVVFMVGIFVPGFTLYNPISYVFSGGFFNQNGFAFYVALSVDLALLLLWRRNWRINLILALSSLMIAAMFFVLLHTYTAVIVILLMVAWLVIFPLFSPFLRNLFVMGIVFFPFFATLIVSLVTISFGHSNIVDIINRVMTLRPQYWSWYHEHFGFHFVGQRIEASARGLNPPENGVLDGAYFYFMLRQGIFATIILIGLISNLAIGFSRNLEKNWQVLGLVGVLFVSGLPENQLFQVTFSPIIILAFWALIKGGETNG